LKKILSIFAAFTLALVNATPVVADTSNVPALGEFSYWASAEESSSLNITIGGSLIEGDTFTVAASGSCPATDEWTVSFGRDLGATRNGANTNRYETSLAFASSGVEIASTTNYNFNDPSSFGFQIAPISFTAGVAGTSQYFVVHSGCAYYQDGVTTGSWAIPFRSSIVKVTFESLQLLAAPTGIRFAPGANFTNIYWTPSIHHPSLDPTNTTYTVTANPGGASCTSASTGCRIQGLEVDATYTFSLFATNGSTTSATLESSPVIIRVAADVIASVSSATWKVGDTVRARSTIRGTSLMYNISWLRCDAPISRAITTPGGCNVVSTGLSDTYRLTAGDLGSYISAFVFAYNSFSSSSEMAGNLTNRVLAADAVAPPQSPQPLELPRILTVTNTETSLTGGSEARISGTGLSDVTSVTVGGIEATIVSKSDTTLTFRLPAANSLGLADLLVSNAIGADTLTGAILYTTNPVIKITKTKTITGFKAGQKVLTTAQKTAVKALITANPTLTTLACAAKTTGVASNKTELAKAKTLATATCAYAKTLKKTLIVSSTASQTLPKSKASRSVALTLKN
jgi:hypothetical protein